MTNRISDQNQINLTIREITSFIICQMTAQQFAIASLGCSV